MYGLESQDINVCLQQGEEGFSSLQLTCCFGSHSHFCPLGTGSSSYPRAKIYQLTSICSWGEEYM